MAAPIALIELALMSDMYQGTRPNALTAVAGAIAAVMFLSFIRGPRRFGIARG